MSFFRGQGDSKYATAKRKLVGVTQKITAFMQHIVQVAATPCKKEPT
jgi:hypothetical protein